MCMLLAYEKEMLTGEYQIKGPLHRSKNSGLNLWKFLVADGTVFAGISREKGSLMRSPMGHKTIAVLMDGLSIGVL